MNQFSNLVVDKNDRRVDVRLQKYDMISKIKRSNSTSGITTVNEGSIEFL